TLTSEDLSYGHSGGLVENQEEFLKVFESKSQDYRVWDVRDLSVSFHGENTAMMRYYVNAEIVTNEVPNKLDLGLLMVWIKEEGSWKLLARQAFRVPK
ncbi:MAG: nuclear transport factor 2 family protein, partial [Cyclobacteriaceae bacterium]|nr:nuclear transport factor 2 family protein [Cyclobacteriaceae bacterium]MDX5466366.1 nuclear transport factor 2 family protein [Cyclobacteriaceae bacterium]